MNHTTRMARRSSWALGCWLLSLLGSLVLGSLAGGAAPAWDSSSEGIPGQLTFHDAQLTAHLRGASLLQVMAEVARLSGVQVRWMDTEVGEQLVSVEVRELALAEGVRRILRAHNILLVYTSSDEGTRLTQVWIASRDNTSEPPGPFQPPARLAPRPPPEDEPATAMDEPAAAVERSVEMLIQTATADEDLAARLSAIGELGSHTPEDARVREILEDLADDDLNPQVRDAASMLLGGGR
jgi:hypothetical protein